MKAKTKQNINIVLMMLAVLLIAGTLAWQSFSQRATNETIVHNPSPGGRLHDDFDGSNKDVYIENYAATSGGLEVYARIRLTEYLELGEEAGSETIDRTDAESGITVLRGDKQNQVDVPEFDDETTWDTFIYGTDVDPDTENIRTYSKLMFGGETIYMPTFNKDLNCIDADINGTYAEEYELGDREHYDDYVSYFLGEPKTEDAKYAYEDLGGPVIGPILGTHYYYEEETHRAERTLVAEVISMERWQELGEPIGNYWVYDTDGWAYWADAIMPQTATGLLLDEITYITKPKQDWFYAIHVVAQIATAGDWGEGIASNDTTASSGNGMYEGGITEDGLYLLNKVADL